MLRTIRRLILLLAAACLTVGRAQAAEPPQTNTAAPVQPSAAADDTLVAKGKGIAITRGELEKEAEAAKAQMKLRSRPAVPDQNHAAERQVLEQLINIQLLMAKATAGRQSRRQGGCRKTVRRLDRKSRLRGGLR